MHLYPQTLKPGYGHAPKSFTYCLQTPNAVKVTVWWSLHCRHMSSRHVSSDVPLCFLFNEELIFTRYRNT